MLLSTPSAHHVRADDVRVSDRCSTMLVPSARRVAMVPYRRAIPRTPRLARRQRPAASRALNTRLPKTRVPYRAVRDANATDTSIRRPSASNQLLTRTPLACHGPQKNRVTLLTDRSETVPRDNVNLLTL